MFKTMLYITAAIAIPSLLIISGVYWVWTAIQIGSFTMFATGLVPICWIVTIPVGAYSLIYAVPPWVLSTFS